MTCTGGSSWLVLKIGRKRVHLEKPGFAASRNEHQRVAAEPAAIP
jgi:hypothetical protein